MTELDSRLLEAFKAAEAKKDKCPPHLIQQLFNIHNEVFPQTREYATGCGGCVRRVFSRCRTHLQNLKLI